NTRYNANTARGYDPLTEEQKETMSEKTIEKWENTIKDSLLRRDSTLSTLISSFKTALGTQVEVDGKNYSLSSFGIVTGDYSERGLLHISGDKDDPTHATEEDKLLKAIEEDPELVSKVFSEIGKNLYDTMSKQMASIPNVRSAFTFYNDKLMDKQVTRYEREISNLEKKLYELEEKYYDQFAKMEAALSKMQSQSNYLYSMMGMN
ncbi:MAG: flagellar filament capping protein FliD, partial [Clostridiales bacterium]|nr:flagellar filament capping protein FliD [Clostridiales bacterium]